MSVAPVSSSNAYQDTPDGRAGAIALIALRMTVLGLAGGLVFTIGKVVWQVAAG